MPRASVIVAVVAAAHCVAAPRAAAELISSRPVTIVIPFTPGASADTLQRIVGRKVSEETGQILALPALRYGSSL